MREEGLDLAVAVEADPLDVAERPLRLADVGGVPQVVGDGDLAASDDEDVVISGVPPPALADLVTHGSSQPHAERRLHVWGENGEKKRWLPPVPKRKTPDLRGF